MKCAACGQRGEVRGEEAFELRGKWSKGWLAGPPGGWRQVSYLRGEGDPEAFVEHAEASSSPMSPTSRDHSVTEHPVIVTFPQVSGLPHLSGWNVIRHPELNHI